MWKDEYERILEGDTNMKLTVLGATGRTGTRLVDRALAAGHEVTAPVRNPSAIQIRDPRLRVVESDVTSVGSLIEVIRGVDAVCSMLGSAAPRKPTTLYSASITAVIAAMSQAGVRRVVAVTAIPAEPDELKTFVDRLIVHRLLHAFFGGGYDDMVRMEKLLRGSDTDWTVLRPPRLTDAKPRNTYRTGIDSRLARAGKIPRSDLAQAILDAVGDRSLIGHGVTVAS
jgi:putative NADH-flavin reductase